MTRRGEALLRRVQAGETGELTVELLTEFFHGHPVVDLRSLLRSTNEDVVRAGAWLASELAIRARPLVGELHKLLEHPSRHVRFWTIDALLTATTSRHGRSIAGAIRCIRDSDRAVRWSAACFLRGASPVQLRAGMKHLDSDLASLVGWLLRASISLDAKDISARLHDAGAVARYVAAAAAARVGAENREPLELAAQSEDTEVRSFARSELDILDL